MTEFGPFARWPDPRAYDLIAGYNWGAFQRALLLGHQSWAWSGMTKYQRKAYDAVEECLEERGYKVSRSPAHTSDVVTITLDGIPPFDSNLAAMVEQWKLRMERVQFLALEGPVEMVDGVPVFRATVFGSMRRYGDRRRRGILAGVYVVGRVDVSLGLHTRWRGVLRWQQWGDLHQPQSRIMPTLRRARTVARKVAGATGNWDGYQAELARDAEAGRLAEEAAAAEAEPVDEDLAAFRP